MARFFALLLPTFLLFTKLCTINCYNKEALARNGRSNHYRPVNLYRPPEAKYDDKEEFKTKDQQLSPTEVEARIKNIFIVPSEPQLSSFSPTADTDLIPAYTGNRDSPVLFPANEPNKESPFSVDVNECLEQGKTFCTKVRNYPKLEHMEDALKRDFPNVELFFGEDIEVPQSIMPNINIDPFDEFLCRSREKIIYPQAAESKSSNWSYIVNDSNFKQGIRIEECEREGSQCNSRLSVPKGYHATCKQNFIFRSMVALTPMGKLITDHFKMPSCCKCVLTQTKN
ncbi:spaetzle domain-containing protein isoform 10-T12 [Glossina fuscipes fuscipes]